MQPQHCRDNGEVAFSSRGSQAQIGGCGAVRHAPARARARARPHRCPPARQSAEAVAAAPRGVTAPSQWPRWRRARDCAAARALREGSLGLRPGVDGRILTAASGAGRGNERRAAARATPVRRPDRETGAWGGQATQRKCSCGHRRTGGGKWKSKALTPPRGGKAAPGCGDGSTA